jgi:actin cytoskeleton-regulatory complex protein SLA1
MVVLTWKGTWGKNAVVTFQNGRVIAKSQFGLPQGDASPQKTEEEHPEASPQPPKKEQPPKPAATEPTNRKWTDATGNHTIEAEFGGMANGKVKLKKADGSVITIPLEKLSEDDQEWITKRGR